MKHKEVTTDFYIALENAPDVTSLQISQDKLQNTSLTQLFSTFPINGLFIGKQVVCSKSA